jgi:K+-transporting ATPase KdpF subunit
MPPQPAMSGLAWIAQDLGLVVLTLVVVALTAYLVYAMVHPERI